MKPRALLALDRLRRTGCSMCGKPAQPDAALCAPCEKAVLEEDDDWWVEPEYSARFSLDEEDDLPF